MSKSQKIYEIRALNADSNKLTVKTSEGPFNIPWNSITHAYIFNVKGYGTVLKPVLLMNVKTSEDNSILLSLPAEKVGSTKMVVDGKIIMKMLISKISLDMSVDPVFTEVVQKLCSHFTWTYIDAPLKNFVSNGSQNFPHCDDEQQILDYCGKLDEGLRSGGEQAYEDSLKEIHETAAPVTSREKWEIGSEIDGIYTVKNILSGGMGIVYIIEDKEREKTYALKTFKDEFIYDTTVCNQFIKEAEIWTKLGKHKNIVQAERVMIREGQPYIFLEFIDGKELEEILRTDGRLTALDAVNYSLQLCSGMTYAWTLMGLIHRDLKPANCFITKEKTLKISDFGLGTMSMAKKESSNDDGGDALGSAIVGTFPYMAPELFMGGNMASTQTDIYAFGIILCEMLTGVNPFFDEDPSEIIDRHMNLETSLFDNANEEITPELDYIYRKCVDKDPANRYKTFEEIYEDLSVVYEDLSGSEFKKTVHETFSEEDLIKRGLSLANLRQYPEAIKIYDQAIELNRRSPALLHKGKALSAMGRYDEALQDLDIFAEMHGSYWRVWLYKGDVYRCAKNYDEALKCIEKAEELSRDNAEILSAKGHIKGDLGEIQEAIALCEESLELDEKMPETWYLLGYYYMQQKKYEGAKDAFVEASELNPRYIEALVKRGQCFRELGFYKEATTAFKRALTLDGGNLDCLLGLTETAIETGDLKAANLNCSKIFEKESPPPEAVLAKAHLLEMEKHDEEAIELLTGFIQKYPDERRLKLKLAEIYLKISDPISALGIFTELFPNQPEHGTTDEAIMRSAQTKLDYGRALASEISDRNRLTFGMVVSDLNSFLSYTHDNEFAITVAEKISLYGMAMERLKALIFLCIMLRLEGRSEEAEAIHSRLMEENPKEPLVQEIGARLFPRQKDSGFFHRLELNKFAKTQEGMIIDALVESREGDMQKALEMFKACLDKYPDSTCCLLRAGTILEKMGDLDSAEVMIEKFEKEFPNSFGLYRSRLEKAERIGDVPEAERLIKRIISLTPYSAEIWLRYIDMLMEYGQDEKAVMTASYLLDNIAGKSVFDRESADYKNMNGFLNLLLKRYEAAKGWYEAAYSEDPSSMSATFGLAKCNICLGNDSEAQQLLKSGPAAGNPVAKCLLTETSDGSDLDSALAITGQASSPSGDETDVLLMKRLQLLCDNGKTKEAAELAKTMTRFYPDKPIVMYSLLKGEPMLSDSIISDDKLRTYNSYTLKIAAREFLERGDYAKGEAVLKRAIGANSFDSEAKNLLGILHYRAGRYMEASDMFDKALNEDPGNPQIWANLGAALWHIGENEKARGAFHNARETRYSPVNPVTNCGIYLLESGSLMRAKEFTEKALRLDNKYYPAWIARGRTLLRYGNLEDALASADSAIMTNPSDPRGWILKSSIQIETEDIQGSVYTLRKVAEIDENEPVIWYNLALATVKEGKSDLAASYLQKAMKAKPNFFEALFLYGAFLYNAGQRDRYGVCMAKAREANPGKYEKWTRLIQIKKNMAAPFKSLDRTGEPFFIEPFGGIVHQPIIRMSDFTPIIGR